MARKVKEKQPRAVKAKAPARAEPSAKKSTPRRAKSAVVQSRSLSDELTRIGGNMTPRMVSLYYRLADEGQIYDLVNLAHECRQKDGHLHGILSIREDALNDIEWRVSDSTDEIVEFVTEELERMESGVDDADESLSFSGLVEHLQSANYFGFADAELQWKKRGRHLVPDKIWPISHRRFRYRESDGVLVQLDREEPSSSPGKRLLHDYAPGNFIQHTPRVTGDVGAREGLMHVLIWASLFRNWALKDWLQLAELGWKPWRTAQYDKNIGEEEIEDLKTMLRSMSATNVGMYSKDIELKVEWPKSGGTSSGGQSSHSELVTWLAKEMSKATLGATDVLEPSDVGSMAAVRIREKRPQAKRAIDGGRLSRTIRRQLIAPLVRINFGPDAKVPKFKFITQEPTDIETFGLGVKSLHESGVTLGQQWCRDMVGAKEPRDDADKLLRFESAGETTKDSKNASGKKVKNTPSEK